MEASQYWACQGFPLNEPGQYLSASFKVFSHFPGSVMPLAMFIRLNPQFHTNFTQQQGSSESLLKFQNTRQK